MTQDAPRQGTARTAVVTGAAGGVGSHTVHTLASLGWRVVAVVRTSQDAGSLERIDGVEATAVDLSDTDGLSAWAETQLAPRLSDGLDLLVHAAAVASVGPAADADAATWQRVLRTNVAAPALLTGALLPQVRAARGTIVFINSGAGERAVPDHAVYAASKHALRGYANTLRLEEAGHGVRVTTIYPGQIDTKMLAGIDRTLDVPFEPDRYIRPQTVADTIAWVAGLGPDAHVTNLDLRPRQEVGAEFNV
ncbi:SDR family oxidoreductase [Bifidobacterium cuniculi]|uniref:Short chain dehydrogenase n=1 Tax=Bifidobacterium cuniculi TaxID=1688 RepID=A0A087AM07_9BIFI|nr:SDR family oxidoreductase [Bifidobacterium cuniculi]KFI59807.1 short chain dehydrogenase [Bifidobacterium cuniculi]